MAADASSPTLQYVSYPNGLRLTLVCVVEATRARLWRFFSMFISVIHATSTSISVHHVRSWAQRTGAGGQARFRSQTAVPSQHPHIAGCCYAQHSPLPQHGGYIKVCKHCLRFYSKWHMEFTQPQSPYLLFFSTFCSVLLDQKLTQVRQVHQRMRSLLPPPTTPKSPVRKMRLRAVSSQTMIMTAFV